MHRELPTAEEAKKKDMGKEDMKRVNIHIVHSMKGGCGKSTCALFMALKAACGQDIKDRSPHVLYVDADFKGSAMMKILFRVEKSEDMNVISQNERQGGLISGGTGDDKADSSGLQHIFAVPDNYCADKTLSNYLNGSPLTAPDIIFRSCSYSETEKKKTGEDAEPGKEIYINGFVDFILSSASAESKDWFRYMPGKIAAGIYCVRMETLLWSILKMGKINKEQRGTYSDIVIDMPPGYDEYSDILLDILRDIAKSEDDIRLCYYGVTTEDLGHRALTEDNLNKMMSYTEKYKPFFSVNLVLSAVSSADFAEFTQSEKEVFSKWIKREGNANGKVYEIKYSESYHRFCRVEEEKGFVAAVEELLQKVTEAI